ncbi:hypothetical protein PTKIN_Ptkin19aG0114700 [Pterospermum kingtungense]
MCWSAGEEPLVVARGGFSGLFPDSSVFAFDMANQLRVSQMALLCNLQLTQDNVGICLPDVNMKNSTNIPYIYPEERKTYIIDGQEVTGWFTFDKTADVLITNVSLVQSVNARPVSFDNLLPLSTVEDVLGINASVFWLNVEYDSLYAEHKLSVSDYVESAMGYATINFISSTDIGFLKKIGKRVNKARRSTTKLILRFPGPEEIEPTTKLTYADILKDLAAIKQYATGILVPKGYIWALDAKQYLGNPTTLVQDAHKLGLEAYAYGFANDLPLSYNYSQDPTNEYLQFIANPYFSVDGLITDFPSTAAMSVENVLIITHCGASGVYPGCTDLAYEQAISDGADVIDCSVQMTKDGVALCLETPDLTASTTALPTFATRSSSIPEIQKDNGIFSFDLTWIEIQTLKPQIVNPFEQQSKRRNPEAKNKGKFMTLTEFLEFAKAKAVPGILINIENAAYLASKKGFDIVDTVTKALSNASFDKQQTQQVFIESDDSSVLSKFQGISTYKRYLNIENKISDAPKPAVDEIKKYADGVVVTRPSLITIQKGYAKRKTNVVQEMHAANLPVFVFVFRNEFTAYPFDFYADPMVELATYITLLGIDGVITEFPATASRYLSSSCVDSNGTTAILPAVPGELLSQIEYMREGQPEEPAASQAPTEPPNPPLEIKDVVDPPLPQVANVSSPSSSSSTASPGSKTGAPSSSSSSSSSGLSITANFGLYIAVAIMALTFLSMGH